MTLWEYDQSLETPLLCGVDEAGRGPLAGDVYAAAVILDPENPIEGLNDSKKLTEKRRETLFPEIQQKALAWSVGIATVSEIDTYNILQATFLAMNRAVAGLSLSPRLVLVDGNRDPGLPVPTRLLVKGDAISASVAAASILAKVSRDHAMLQLAEQYPQYQFERHKGYGTALHYEMLDRYGISPVHRRSFLKKYLKEAAERLSIGSRGEGIAAQYLAGAGCQLLAAGVHCEGGELDLIAREGELTLFVEVKTRTGAASPAEAVDAAKQAHLVRAARDWMARQGTEMHCRFDVVEVELAPDGSTRSVRWLKDAFRPS